MPEHGLHYLPLASPLFFVLTLAVLFLFGFLWVGGLQYAYESIGVGRRHMLFLLLVTLLGSYVNIPVYHLPAQRVVSHSVVEFFGMQYVVPTVVNWPGTVIAVNLGGAVIPTLVSLYLVVRNRLYLRALLGVAVVAVGVHLLARPVPGIGIAEPFFIPPLFTAIVALLLSRRHAPPLAYVCGSLGTLVGADLMNFGAIRGMGAPVASIGGAGTFDGIFLTGIIAVILATLVVPRPSAGGA